MPTAAGKLSNGQAFNPVRQETTMNELHSRGKIVRGTEGMGTVTPQMFEERAREIACIDGRTQPNDLDRTSAHEELTGAASGSEKRLTRQEPHRDWQIPRFVRDVR